MKLLDKPNDLHSVENLHETLTLVWLCDYGRLGRKCIAGQSQSTRPVQKADKEASQNTPEG